MRAGSAPYYLALDIGTTSVKAVLFDAAGRPCFEDRVVIRLQHPRPDWAEIDARDWWEAVVALCDRLTTTSPPEEIAAIGVTGLMHALVPVDGAGEPLDRVILWFDQRAHRQRAWLAERWDERLGAVLGGPPGSNSAAPKLLWLRQERPGLIERTHAFLTAKDFIRLRLTGEIATDPTDAGGTGLTERGAGVWSALLLEVLEVPRSSLPPIRRSAEVVGQVIPAAARTTGLAAGTPVVAGIADMPATLLGMNAFVPGRAMVYMGTGVWMALSQPGGTDETPAIRFLGATATCGSSLVWWQRAIGGAGEGELDVADIYRALEGAATVRAGAGGLFFLPHLMGERGFGADPHARGVFFGLTLAHRAPHLLRAILEGNAFQVRRNLEHTAARPDALPLPETLVLAGGGVRAPVWRSILADVLGRAVQIPTAGEATAMGAATLAAVGAGAFPHPRAAADAWVGLDDPAPPDPVRAAFYDRAYCLFCDLESAVAPLYARAADLGSSEGKWIHHPLR